MNAYNGKSDANLRDARFAGMWFGWSPGQNPAAAVLSFLWHRL
jgi:hypothetical protein